MRVGKRRQRNSMHVDMEKQKCGMGAGVERLQTRRGVYARRMGGYMTVEAALVMSVVFMVYVFLIDTMIMQYERCVEELEGAREVVLNVVGEEPMYEVAVLDPVGILRLQRAMLHKNMQGEEKEE